MQGQRKLRNTVLCGRQVRDGAGKGLYGKLGHGQDGEFMRRMSEKLHAFLAWTGELESR